MFALFAYTGISLRIYGPTSHRYQWKCCILKSIEFRAKRSEIWSHGPIKIVYIIIMLKNEMKGMCVVISAAR